MVENNFKNNTLNFGPKLKQIRKDKDFTVRQVAMQSKISASYWSQVENKKREIPTAKTLEKMAKGLNVKADEIFKIAGVSHKNNSYIGPNIKRLMEKHNLSVEEVSKSIQVEKQTISNWINGIEIPKMGSIQKMSDLFGVSIDNITEDVKENEISDKKTFDLKKAIDNDEVMSYGGKQLSQLEKEMVKRILEGK